jgi:indole-3-glycerol phosphate synthase
MSNVLDKICADKRNHVDAKIVECSFDDVKKIAESQTPTRGFIHSLKNNAGIALITEVKKASPSKGVIRENFNPVDIAKIYEDNGAACLSVLTDEKYFQGHDDYFTAIRENVSLPMLRKDFMIDEYQIYESRALGADCILLIMACLSDAQAKDFYALATSLGMDSLFEVHDEDELERAIKLTPKMVGVNNRNLKTLDVDLETGLSLATKIPDTVLKVAESGIYNHADIQKFIDVGYGAFLIGESLMREEDIGAAVRKIRG